MLLTHPDKIIMRYLMVTNPDKIITKVLIFRKQ
jgi:hypothetical protein